MAIYSIKDLENIVGIKAHTLRMWEQRYSILKPQRTKTNIRYYMDEDLQFLLNISLLYKNGIKISRIAKMSSVEINQKVRALSQVNYEHNSKLHVLTIAMISMDQKMFSQIINANIKHLGFKQTMIDVVVPFIDRMASLGLTGSVTALHSQFISNVICQKIIVAIDELDYTCNKSSKCFLMYSPEESHSDLRMLFAYYLLKEQGGKVIFLGGGVRIEDLIAMKEKPDYFYVMINSISFTDCQEYINFACEHFKEQQLLFSGFSIGESLKMPENAKALHGLPQTATFIESLET